MSATLALPDYVIGVRETYGLTSAELLYTVEEHTDGSVPAGDIEGVLVGAWDDPDPIEVPLVYGSWTGGLTSADVAVDDWSA